MLHISEVIVVEGKYDAIKLSSFVDAPIFVTNGFGIFKDKERLELLRQMGKNRGIVVLTDSDGAGLVIRNYLIGSLPGITIKQAFIPAIEGKERRKRKSSKEGLLGVEGVKKEDIQYALQSAGILLKNPEERKDWLTKNRLFEDGLVGTTDSAQKRKKLLSLYGLPQNLSTNKLLCWMNTAMSEEEYYKVLELI